MSDKRSSEANSREEWERLAGDAWIHGTKEETPMMTKRKVRNRSEATTSAERRSVEESIRLFVRKRKAARDTGDEEEARERENQDDPERSRDRERSMVQGTGERESKPPRDGRDSWICKWRRGVETREGDLPIICWRETLWRK